MNNNPMFSVIIPAYNAESTVENCIESVEKQGLADVEIVVVNDGSTDATGEVIKQIQKKHSNIRFVSKIQGGVASARNFGIDNSKGNFLIFLDADDELCDNALNTLYEFCSEKKSADMIICDSYSYTDAQDNVYTNRIFNNVNYEDLSFTETKIMCQNLSSMCIGVFSRDFLEKNTMRVREGISVGEDTDFLFRCILKCEKIYITQCNLFLYRYNEASVTRNLSKKNILDLMTVCDERINDILSNKPADIDEKKALAFFAEKFIHFGIKLNRLPKEDKDELIQFIRKRKHITCYSNSIPDKVFCVLIHVLGVRFSCFVFDTIVKMRNSLRGG